MTAPAFVDLETTGLDPDRHEAWEIAVIRRDPDGTETEHLWQLRPTDLHLAHVADLKALEIGRYRERMAVPRPAFAAAMPTAVGGPVLPLTLDDLTNQVHAALDGAVMVGSNPAFDAAFLRVLLDAAPWHYRVIDVATLAAGYIHGRHSRALEDGELEAVTHPWKSYQLARAVGVEPPAADVAHTALGDAKWAMAVFDAVTAHTRPLAPQQRTEEAS